MTDNVNQPNPALPQEPTTAADEELVTFDKLEGYEPEALEPDQVTPAAAALPEKFKGKSVEEIANVYGNLEADHGRLANEVGQLRKLTDQLLQLQNAAPAAHREQSEQKPTLSVEQLLEDPQGAIESAVSNHPAVLQARQSAETSKQESAVSMLKQSHADYEKVLLSPEFSQWAEANPVQRDILIYGNNAYRPDMVAEVLTRYKDSMPKADGPEKQEQDLRAASVESRSAAAAPGSVKKPVFLRQELAQLRLDNPAKYDALYPVIALAYKEGRVR